MDGYFAYFERHRDMLRSAGPPQLLHDDANISNVIFDEELKLRALIDFDDATVAPAEEEYWNMAFELLDEPGCTRDVIKHWLKGHYAFDDPEALIRLKLSEVYWNLFCMTEDLSWRSQRTSRREAAEDFRENFVENRLQDWFS